MSCKVQNILGGFPYSPTDPRVSPHDSSAGLEFRDPAASASTVLGLKACAPTSSGFPYLLR